ncbi:MAG: 1-(5-phosphoribosyl)-5-[(5-phosphoribosylamino)methylideneamino]imidazole-4-carboxamide isomerase [Deltaproteobacteria bacterium]|nr:1-(5-phosphoribosyl)-5-[(5-phosphoribosylamino)methylideneamino]imidazole-4-carboxamide isomerase [Deltaproteobacteria bacterium]
MLIIPAIDLKDGKCVRLYQGDMKQATIYSDDPVATAVRWQEEGAERLHVVDLDGAVSGAGVNTKVIRQICKTVSIPVQVGGGIRNLEAVERLFFLGVHRAILGTVAYSAPTVVETVCQRFPGKITVGIDARNGKVAVQGWTEITSLEATALATQCAGLGVSEIIYTDIGRDGTESGVNIDSTVALAQVVSIPVIASGGVASLRDIQRLAQYEGKGIKGVIVGKALYTGAVNLAEAIKVGKHLPH